MEDVAEGPLLIEVAWEVARKVGGIYTVLKTKLPFTCNIWGNRYALVGVYNYESAATEFEPVEPRPLYAQVIKNLERNNPGIRVHYGRWLVQGYPSVFLFELRSSEQYLHQWREQLMSGFSRPSDSEMNEFIIFGYQVSCLLEEFTKLNKQIIAQFHEYQTGIGLIMTKRKNLPIASVFTTHATLLGRYMCAARLNFYNLVSTLDADKEARERDIFHRFWVEREATQQATIFTTVSEITAFEALHILKRKVDVITPNGLNIERFTALHTFQNLHARYKAKISNFVRGHFYGFYDFDIDKTLYFFTAGRYEYFNKGVNLFLDALQRLNDVLKATHSDVTIVAFIIMPDETNNFNVESLKGQSLLRDLKDTCSDIVERLGAEIYENALKGNLQKTITFSKEDEVMLKRRIVALKGRKTLPPIVTHNMVNDSQNEILNHIRSMQMFNKPEDRVKLIYHPEFLSSTSTVLPLDYPDFVRGCHLGVFTSYYEPWGYTPAECTVLGVPSVSSNLTGFANYINNHVEDPKASGITIIDRRNSSYEEQVLETCNEMVKFCHLTRRERIELRNKTENLSQLLDWNVLGDAYTQAYKKAYSVAYSQELHEKSNFFTTPEDILDF